MTMEAMAGHMDSDPTGMVIQPGETGQLTWQFTNQDRSSLRVISPGIIRRG